MIDSAMPPFASSESLPGWQYLEDLACAYWKSELLFTSLDLDIFSYLKKPKSTEQLAEATKSDSPKLHKLLYGLLKLNLVDYQNDLWQNTHLADRYLVSDAKEHLGNFLLYRRYLQSPWQNLSGTISTSAGKTSLSADDAYQKRTLYYVRALDELAKLKADEIVKHLTSLPIGKRFLDIGGGAGALCHKLLKHTPDADAVLFDLPETIEAAKRLYPGALWGSVHTLEGNFLDYDFAKVEPFSLILLSNVLHIYDYVTAKAVLRKAITLAADDGILVIHDYFPDRDNHQDKGGLYDLNMMLNTYNGTCHDSQTLCLLLAEAGLTNTQLIDLESDSTILIAHRP